jgi:hypothetical protein
MDWPVRGGGKGDFRRLAFFFAGQGLGANPEFPPKWLKIIDPLVRIVILSMQ